MGTFMGPSYACLFVGYVEQSTFRSYTGTTSHLFLRYIDDCIGAASCSHEEVEQFIHFTNTFHPDFKFTCTISDSSLPFLDLSISISDDRINTDIYYKPTDSYSYLDYTSSHPTPCKNAIPYFQSLHLRHICSQEDQFQYRTTQMASFFKDRNFPLDMIDDALHHISSTSCSSTLEPRSTNCYQDRTPLVLTYHPTNLHIHRIIHRHFRHLQTDPTTRDIFPSPPLSAFRKDHSLRDRKKCKTCAHTSPLISLQGPKGFFHICLKFPCTSIHIIYCIRCTQCGLLYIGETGRLLAEHFREHLWDTRTNQPNHPVAQHFNSPSHSTKDMQVLGLLHRQTRATRRLEEERLIFHLGTLHHKG
ncbi:uncharacterized protein [Chiloscyllium punctatum]|uniref:uncharacterized protein isoform X1 n=1 Tax=Chiloscyllium punctatum TaxID=137246 RepID=UPI003B636A07